MTGTLILICVALVSAVVFLHFRNVKVKEQCAKEVAAAEAATSQSREKLEAFSHVVIQRAEEEVLLAKAYAVEAEARLEASAAASKQQAREEVRAANSAVSDAKIRFESEARAIRQEAAELISKAKIELGQKLRELNDHAEAMRRHYEAEARRAGDATKQYHAELVSELESLRPYKDQSRTEEEIKRKLESALLAADELKIEAAAALEAAKTSALAERAAAHERAKLLHEQAEALLTQATKEARKVTDDAEKRALQTAGDAYRALREKDDLDRVVRALRNVVEGYGDRYIIPTRSLLDDLAADFGHTEAGASLRAARERSRLMVVHGESASCEYAEPNRRHTAIRFVVDAFNGRVDAILTRVKHDNFGTLEQEIRDSASLVNLNGQAFRDARILPGYVDARLSELRWAVVAQELKLKEREEQRQIQEQIREEEKARREYERALQETAREEAALRRAMEIARAEAARASVEERAKYQAQMDKLAIRLAEAEAKNQRALSMAQQTRAGHVYIISNEGSFGNDVFKIGLTRRLQPLDRVRELGDASVPFLFDVHAMIYSEDAPALERLLHSEFDDFRINKVNYRKEFFRIPLDRVRLLVVEKGLEATFTMAADAHEYRETLALEKMPPEERRRYQSRWKSDNAQRDLKMVALVAEIGSNERVDPLEE